MTLTDKTPQSQAESISFEFDFHHAPEKVWRALTDPVLLVEWLLPVVELKRAALEVFGAQRVLAAVLPVMAPLAGDWTLISFDLEVLQLARREAEVPLGPVLESFDQLQSATTLELEPDVIFCNQKRLPAAGPLEVQAPLVVYELDRAAPTRALIERGAALIETFAIGDLLAELSGH